MEPGIRARRPVSMQSGSTKKRWKLTKDYYWDKLVQENLFCLYFKAPLTGRLGSSIGIPSNPYTISVPVVSKPQKE